MDAALLAEREAFKRRAMAVPTVENKKKRTEDSKKSSGSMKPPKGGSFKSFGAGSQYKFGVLGKIYCLILKELNTISCELLRGMSNHNGTLTVFSC